MPLRTVPPFNSLPEETLIALEKLSSIIVYPAGTIIITEGSVSSTDFFVITCGSCRVTVKGVDLAVRSVGDIVGTVSNLHNTTRTATVTAIDDVTVVVFNGKDFPAFLDLLPKDLVDGIHSSVSDMLASVLRLLPIFEGVPEEKVPLLARLFHFEVFKKGDIVIKEGNIGDKFYIVMNGRAIVTKNVDGEEKYLDTRVEGEWFGGIALIKKTLRTASVSAENDLTCLVLNEVHFDGFLFQLPPALQKTVNDYATKRTISIVKLLPFFSAFPQDKLELLISLFHFKVVNQGEVFLQEGHTSKFVLVLRGIVALTKKTKDGTFKSIGTCEQNEFFGEECLMKDCEILQSCNAVGVTVCSLLVLDPSAFTRYVETFSDLTDVRKAINRHNLKKSLLGRVGAQMSKIEGGTGTKERKTGSFA